MYVKDDLCFQQVYEFSYLSKIGMINCKNFNTYEDNIAFNEIPLVFQDKDDLLSSNSSLNYAGIAENLSSNINLRESVLSHFDKRNSAIYSRFSVPINKSINSSMISNIDSNNSVLCLNKAMSGACHLNTYIMFEESDDSSFSVSASSGSESNSED